MDSISIVWVKNNEQDAHYQEILHNLMKINPGLALTDLGLASDGADTICTPQKNGEDRSSKGSSQIRIQRLDTYLFYSQFYPQTEWKPFMIRLPSRISIEIPHSTHVLAKIASVTTLQAFGDNKNIHSERFYSNHKKMKETWRLRAVYFSSHRFFFFCLTFYTHQCSLDLCVRPDIEILWAKCAHTEVLEIKLSGRMLLLFYLSLSPQKGCSQPCATYLQTAAG